MDDAGMVRNDNLDSKSQSMQIQIGNEDSNVQSAEMVSEQVGGLTEMNVMEAEDNGDVKFKATMIDIQPVGEKTESQLVPAEENSSNLKPVAMESVGIDGTAELRSHAMITTKLVGLVTEDVFIYD